MSLTVLSQKWVKARKPHRCEVTGQAIFVGEVHYCQNCVRDSEAYSFRVSEFGQWLFDRYVSDLDDDGDGVRGDQVFDAALDEFGTLQKAKELWEAKS